MAFETLSLNISRVAQTLGTAYAKGPDEGDSRSYPFGNLQAIRWCFEATLSGMEEEKHRRTTSPTQ